MIKRMKHAAIIILALLMAGTVSAQTEREKYEAAKRQAMGQYASQRKKAMAEYAAFRKKANEDYARYMQEAWEAMKVNKGEKPPAQPKPKRAPQVAPDKLHEATPLPTPVVVPAPRQVPPPPVPEENIPEPAPTAPTMQFALYNTPCIVHASENLRFTLPSLSEKSIAEAWKTLSAEKYDGLLHDCLEQRSQLHLSDWGYIRLLKNMSERLLSAQNSNEAVLLQMYLLTQSGMKVRIAKSDGRLVLLVPFDHDIYNYSYITIDGTHYYVLDKKTTGNVEVCKVAFPKEQVASIVMKELPALTSSPSAKRTLEAKQFGTLKAEVRVNKSLIDFLSDYPVSSSWECYANASLSPEVKDALYPVLRSQIKGKSQKKAAQMLLDFVQTAFDYATDQDQFGYERPLFGDESFYYPKNDCEDRSILYSILVRDLLGLDVVLVHWTGHLGTAVCFTDEVDGDYFTIDGKKYVICDPTYIGASVGMTMPQFKNAKAKIVRL